MTTLFSKKYYRILVMLGISALLFVGFGSAAGPLCGDAIEQHTNCHGIVDATYGSLSTLTNVSYGSLIGLTTDRCLYDGGVGDCDTTLNPPFANNGYKAPLYRNGTDYDSQGADVLNGVLYKFDFDNMKSYYDAHGVCNPDDTNTNLWYTGRYKYSATNWFGKNFHYSDQNFYKLDGSGNCDFSTSYAMSTYPSAQDKEDLYDWLGGYAGCVEAGEPIVPTFPDFDSTLQGGQTISGPLDSSTVTASLIAPYYNEQCDDGDSNQEDHCLDDCTLNSCGDGFVNYGEDGIPNNADDIEACDDANTSENDPCVYCQDNVCGDGYINYGPDGMLGGGDDVEQCDDGNLNDNDGCSSTCVLTYCGDGTVQSPNGSGFPELCDDGNTTPGDGCENNCTVTPSGLCGNGVIDTGEACDDGNTSNTDSCTNLCEDAICGDGFVEVGVEECDDANGVNEDECLNSCVINICGDAIPGGIGETCDDGANGDDTDGCSDQCEIIATCGDGVCEGAETCSTCPADCGPCPSTCGNGVVDGVEECDDGNNDDTDACTTECLIAYCGDGITQNWAEDNTGCTGFPPAPNGICERNLGEDEMTCVADCTPGCAGVTSLSSSPTGCSGGGANGAGGFGESACVLWKTIPAPDTGVCQGTEDTWCSVDSDCPLVAGRPGNCLTQDEICVGDSYTEACDDGNTNDNDACSNSCEENICGDGNLNDGETCDDGNTTSGDGCDATCTLETVTCDDMFTDTGGITHQYANNQSVVRQICPSYGAGGQTLGAIALDFATINIEPSTNCANDVLTIYDGPTSASPEVDQYCGVNNNVTVTSTDASGCLYVTFTSDNSVTRAGWSADITCEVVGGDGTCVPFVNTYETQPGTATINACLAGEYADATDSAANRRWECEGTNGGLDTHCAAEKSYCGDAVCSASESCRTCPGDCGRCDTPVCESYTTQTTTQPASDLATGCESGASTYTDQEDSATHWRWQCTSTDGVTTVVCEAPKDAGTCGNGIVELNEECDDDNTNDNDDCTNACTVARCGDGILQNGVEECDREDGCSNICEWIVPSCTLAASSPQTLLGGTIDFNLTYTQQAIGASEFECGGGTVCGDGFIDYDGTDNILGNADDEQCDDGNTTANDGCSATCQFDTPAGSSSAIINSCFNGIQDGVETGIDCGGSCQTC